MMSLLFEDDTNLFESGKDVIKLQHEVEADLKRISEWLMINKLWILKRPISLYLPIRMCINLQLMVIELMKQATLNFLV